jgi:hypothetical protein
MSASAMSFPRAIDSENLRCRAGEVPRHAVQEIRLHSVKVVQAFLDRVARYVGPPLHEVGNPVFLAVTAHDGRVFRPMAGPAREDVAFNVARN